MHTHKETVTGEGTALRNMGDLIGILSLIIDTAILVAVLLK